MVTAILALFAVSVIGVFAQAFQSKNINGGHYLLAACGSMFIGLSQAFIWRAITIQNAGLLETLTYAVGGGTGCVAAMWTHQRFVTKSRK